MTLNSFKKKILAWDEFDKDFYILDNSINTKIEDLLFIEKQKQILLENTILFAQGTYHQIMVCSGAQEVLENHLLFLVFLIMLKKNITLPF